MEKGHGQWDYTFIDRPLSQLDPHRSGANWDRYVSNKNISS